MTQLSGKVALITGGSRGIGQAIVEKYIAEGASVAFTYRSSSEKAEAIISSLNVGDRIKAYQSDASSYEAA